MNYDTLIQNFLHQQAPITGSPIAQFEAVSAAVFGTKQRRFGPMPSPEIQVAVREILRVSGKTITFFMPWGSRKQADGHGVDVMEFMALQQLRCLQMDLHQLGIKSNFVFRLEDLTDKYLFGGTQETFVQSSEYMDTFVRLGHKMLGQGNVFMYQESYFTTTAEFNRHVEDYTPVFYQYLRGMNHVETLRSIGWQGTLPQEQRDYYASAYKSYWPNGEKDVNMEMAKYFAATLARTKLKATGAPLEPHILIAFTHPVPGNPVSKTRLHYRTIPQRFTNNHRSPWIGKGYFEISEDNTVVPKSAGVNETIPGLIKCHQKLDGIIIESDYVLV
jgi:hypothetical protein